MESTDILAGKSLLAHLLLLTQPWKQGLEMPLLPLVLYYHPMHMPLGGVKSIRETNQFFDRLLLCMGTVVPTYVMRSSMILLKIDTVIYSPFINC